MSIGVQTAGGSATDGVRGLSARVGVVAALAAAGLAAYGAYGDPHPKANQQSGVPFLIVVSVVVAAVVFAVLVPKAVRSIRAGERRARWWAVGHGIAAVVLCVAFWSGVPLVVGAGGVLLAVEGRRCSQGATPSARPYSIALGLSVLAIVAAVVLTVLGNTVASHS